MKGGASDISIRNTRESDFDGIIELTRKVYPFAKPWSRHHLASHVSQFPEGQFVAVDGDGRVAGMAASLIVLWDDYDITDSYWDFTDGGMFTNHDPEQGRTLYGAEVMVDPDEQGKGIGKMIYAARRDLVERLGLLRIRAGARLVGYHEYADSLSAEAYVIKILKGKIGDPTLSFQIKQGFHVIAVVSGYWKADPESLGYAAVIEWINDEVAIEADYAGRDRRFDVG